MQLQRRFFVAVVVVAALIMGACSRGSSSPSAPSGASAVVVLKATYGAAPISDAKVTLSNSLGILSNSTDQLGEAHFENVQYANWTATASVFGFSSRETLVGVSNPIVNTSIPMEAVTDIVVDEITADGQGALKSGDTVFYPTTLTMRGRYSVLGRALGSTYHIGVQFSFGGTGYWPENTGVTYSETDSNWESVWRVTGPPCLTVGGVKNCVDSTDIVRNLVDDTRTVVFKKEVPFVLKYQKR